MALKALVLKLMGLGFLRGVGSLGLEWSGAVLFKNPKIESCHEFVKDLAHTRVTLPYLTRLSYRDDTLFTPVHSQL